MSVSSESESLRAETERRERESRLREIESLLFTVLGLELAERRELEQRGVQREQNFLFIAGQSGFLFFKPVRLLGFFTAKPKTEPHRGFFYII